MRRAIAIGLLLTFCAAAQSGLRAPHIGYLRDPGGALLPVVGVGANFLLGLPVMEQVRVAAFSGRFGFVKTDDEVIVVDREAHLLAQATAPGERALFAFRTDGRPALAYVFGAGELLRWDGVFLKRVEWAAALVTEEPLAIAQSSPGVITVVERRGQSLWEVRRRLRDGLIQFEAMLPGVTAPVCLLEDGSLVYTAPHGLTLRRRDATEAHVDLDATVAGFERMGQGWIRVLTDSSRHLALQVTPREARVYRLPGGRR